MAEHNILYTAIEFQDDSPIPGNETTSVDNKENHPKNQIERYKNNLKRPFRFTKEDQLTLKICLEC